MKHAVVVILVVLCVPALFAQMPADQKMPPECAAMMQEQQTMQKHTAEMDAKLKSLVDDMNKAKGSSARLEKMQAVLNELVAQHQMMHNEMTSMQPEMMQHMMEHMQAGAMKGMQDAMSSCPMMKGSAPAQPEHH